MGAAPYIQKHLGVYKLRYVCVYLSVREVIAVHTFAVEGGFGDWQERSIRHLTYLQNCQFAVLKINSNSQWLVGALEVCYSKFYRA